MSSRIMPNNIIFHIKSMKMPQYHRPNYSQNNNATLQNAENTKKLLRLLSS
jgi:hypothetical protein